MHFRTHASVKKFTCESCEKTYSTKRALQEHSRTHTGERPYQCTLCKKSFALPKTLRVHFRYGKAGCKVKEVELAQIQNSCHVIAKITELKVIKNGVA